MQQWYRSFVIFILIALWGLPTYAQDTAACEVGLSGAGNYTCSFEAEAGDIIETSCDGCLGTQFFGSIGWRLSSPSGAVLLDSDSTSTQVTLNSTGTYEFWARYDFGYNIEGGERVCRQDCGPDGNGGSVCGEICDESPSVQYPRYGTLTITIRWISRANPPTSEPVTSDTTQTDGTNTTSETNDSGSGITLPEIDIASIIGHPKFTPIVFLILIVGGILSLIVGFRKKKFGQGFLVAIVLWGSGAAYITVIDTMGRDKVLDFAVNIGVMDFDATINLRPEHNFFDITNISEVLVLSTNDSYYNRPCREIYLLEVNDGEVNRTLLGVGTTPQWSPDGSQIVFVSELGNEAPATCNADRANKIFVVDRDGQNLQQIADEGYLPSWSPDRSQIAYMDSTAPGTLFVINADGTNQRTLSNSSISVIPQWSPDGRNIAFRDSDTYSLMLVNSDGRNLRELLQNWRSNTSYSLWSPDGTWLIAAGKLINSDTGDMVSLWDNELNSDATWTRDGESILSNRGSNLSLIDVDTMEVIVSIDIDAQPSVVVDFLPQVTPDGTQIIYAQGDGQGGNKNETYIILSIDGTQLRRVTLGEDIGRIIEIR